MVPGSVGLAVGLAVGPAVGLVDASTGGVVTAPGESPESVQAANGSSSAATSAPVGLLMPTRYGPGPQPAGREHGRDAAARLGRLPAARALPLGYAAQAVAVGLTGTAILLDRSLAVVGPLAACVAVSVSLTRPVHNALLRLVSDTTGELTAANTATGTVEAATLVGPVGSLGVARHRPRSRSRALPLGACSSPGCDQGHRREAQHQAPRLRPVHRLA